MIDFSWVFEYRGAPSGTVYNYYAMPHGYSSDFLLSDYRISKDGFLPLKTDQQRYVARGIAELCCDTLGKSVIIKNRGDEQVCTDGYILDVARCVMLTIKNVSNVDRDANQSKETLAYAYGYDAYGFPVVSAIVLPGFVGANATVYQIFPKAMKILLGVYAQNYDTELNVSIGISDVLGLPYRVDNISCLSGMWAGNLIGTPGLGSEIAILGANTEDSGSIKIGQYFVPADTYSTLDGSDVRGLFVLPGSNSNTSENKNNSNFNGNHQKANQLVLQIHLPFANTTKPEYYNEGYRVREGYLLDIDPDYHNKKYLFGCEQGDCLQSDPFCVG